MSPIQRLGPRQIAYQILEPEEPAKAIVQIVHGMTEHAGRYQGLVEFLLDRGFLVAIHDHVGHGQSASSPDDLGHFPGPWQDLVQDIDLVQEQARARNPQLPYFLMGHSMGSFLVRAYAAQKGEDLSGLIVMGTAYAPPALLSPVAGLLKIIRALSGPKKRKSSLAKIQTGFFNMGFQEDSSLAWLSKNTDNQEAYAADPLCGFVPTINMYLGIVQMLAAVNRTESFARTNADLPILLISGQEDPVGGKGDGVEKVFEKYQENGHQHVNLRLYPGLRHEILQEDEADQVYQDLAYWMEGILR